MTDQRQSVGISGEGYQAGRDLTVNLGLSPNQMAQIMVALAGQLSKYMGEAEQLFDARCAELRQSLLREFADQASGARTDAFRDPDFQFAVKSAHEGFGRVGTDDLKERLVNLISARSKTATASRSANLLNQAIAISSNLSADEYGVLSALFLVGCVKLVKDSPHQVAEEFHKIANSFSSSLKNVNLAVEYLISIGCVTFSNTFSSEFWSSVYNVYSVLFIKDITQEELQDACQGDPNAALCFEFIDKVDGAEGYYRCRGESFEDINSKINGVDLYPGTKARLRELIGSKMPTQPQFRLLFAHKHISLNDLEIAWNSSILTAASLTLLGKTIAYSVLCRELGPDATMETWIA